MGFEIADVAGIFGSILVAVAAGAVLFRIGKKITVDFDEADKLSENEKIPWEKFEGIDHTFYDKQGAVIHNADDRTDAEGRK